MYSLHFVSEDTKNFPSSGKEIRYSEIPLYLHIRIVRRYKFQFNPSYFNSVDDAEQNDDAQEEKDDQDQDVVDEQRSTVLDESGHTSVHGQDEKNTTFAKNYRGADLIAGAQIRKKKRSKRKKRVVFHTKFWKI